MKNPNFFLSDQEIFARSWWFAAILVLKSTRMRKAFDELTGFSSLRNTGAFDDDKEQQVFYELLAYSSGCMLTYMRDEIERVHGWTQPSFELHMNYVFSLGTTMDCVFGLRDTEKSIFFDLVKDYYSPRYDDDYNEFWNIDYDRPIENDEMFWRAIAAKDQTNTVDRYYAFRVSRVYKVTNPAKVIEVAQPYRKLAMDLYHLAFVELPVEQVKADLAELYK